VTLHGALVYPDGLGGMSDALRGDEGGEMKTAESPPHTRRIQEGPRPCQLVLGGIRCASSFVTDGDSTVAKLIMGRC
jgi:hypothetical protein